MGVLPVESMNIVYINFAMLGNVLHIATGVQLSAEVTFVTT